MKRYRLQGGCLQPPPTNGVCHNGHAISNFAALIEADGDLAAACGYYPCRAVPPPTRPYRTVWQLIDGEWVPTYTLIEMPPEEGD